MNQDKRIALLIDAENITRNYCDIIFSELARYGTVTYRRIYGDFVKNNNINWREKDFLEYSLTPQGGLISLVGRGARRLGAAG